METTLNAPQQLKSRTIKQSKSRTRQRKKLPIHLDSAQTREAPEIGSHEGEPFDPAFLSALDILKSLGYEEYMVKNDSTCMPIRKVLSQLYSLNNSPGVLEDSISLMKRYLTVPQHCCLSIDFHPIQSIVQFVNQTEFFLGCVAPLSTELQLANNIVFFIARGLDSYWKGIVGYMLVHSEDLWAVWHMLVKVIQHLLTSNIFVVNVALSKDFGFEMLEKNSPVDLQAGALMKQQFKGLDLVCFTRDVHEILKEFSECIVQHNIHLTSQILGKYNLSHKVLSHENLRLFFRCDKLSSETIFAWIISWKSDSNYDDLSSISIQSEILFMQMMGKWSNIMTTHSETESLGPISLATDAHMLFLNDIVWIMESLEEKEEIPRVLQLWGDIRKTTISVLALYDNCVAKGNLTCLKPGLLKNLNLQKFRSNVMMPTDACKPLTMLHFLQHVNVTLLLYLNSGDYDFENSGFIKQFIELSNGEILQKDSILLDIDDLGLYVFSSYIVTHLVNKNSCERCQSSLVVKCPNEDFPPEWVKTVESRGFFHPSVNVYDTLQWAESHLVNTEEDIFKLPKVKSQLAFKVYGEMAFSIRNTYPSCHDLLRNMLSIFIGIRLQMMAKDLTRSLL